MKSFIELFIDSRAVSTPLVAVRTFDPASTIRNVRKALDQKHAEDKQYADANSTPLISWDSIHGLKGLGEPNGPGSTALHTMVQLANIEQAATVELAIALGVLEYAAENVIAFIHNPQLKWSSDTNVIQAIWNLRDGYKANGNMAVLLNGVGDELPTELQQDILTLDEPLPTAEELGTIIVDTYKYAAEEPKYKACKGAATPAVVKVATQALIGLPAFPAEQATAMCLEKATGKMDIEQLWERKRNIVSQRPGLTFLQPKETLADMYGNAGFSSFATSFMEGDFSPNVILRVDEIEKQFAGNGTDSSGSTGKQLGEFLSWTADNGVVCTLAVGVPGSSKSWAVQCIAGQYKKPLIKYDLSAMEDKHVGEGGKILRGNERVVEAISDKKIWLIATANSLRGIPPELFSRFQIGGIFFFDVPNDEEKVGIMKLKMARYNRPEQELPEMAGWTGRDIENCARRSQLLGKPLAEVGKRIIPLMKSSPMEMEELRKSAHDRFLSASNDGIYQYTEPPAIKSNVITPVVSAGRKIR